MPSHFTPGKETHKYVPQMTYLDQDREQWLSSFEHRYKPFSYIIVLVKNLLGFQDTLWSTDCGAQ